VGIFAFSGPVKHLGRHQYANWIANYDIARHIAGRIGISDRVPAYVG
jgi:hypothetical protein